MVCELDLNKTAFCFCFVVFWKKKHYKVPGWLSQLGVQLKFLLRSWSHGSRDPAPYQTPCSAGSPPGDSLPLPLPSCCTLCLLNGWITLKKKNYMWFHWWTFLKRQNYRDSLNQWFPGFEARSRAWLQRERIKFLWWLNYLISWGAWLVRQ